MCSIQISQIEPVPAFVNNYPLLCPESDDKSLPEKDFGGLQESRENVVLLTEKYTMAAQAQKQFAELKFKAATNSIYATSENKTVTLVMDFCQNLDLHHLGGEQPGDTYYYSLAWLYCLGIIDILEDRLYMYLYD